MHSWRRDTIESPRSIISAPARASRKRPELSSSWWREGRGGRRRRGGRKGRKSVTRAEVTRLDEVPPCSRCFGARVFPANGRPPQAVFHPFPTRIPAAPLMVERRCAGGRRGLKAVGVGEERGKREEEEERTAVATFVIYDPRYSLSSPHRLRRAHTRHNPIKAALSLLLFPPLSFLSLPVHPVSFDSLNTFASSRSNFGFPGTRRGGRGNVHARNEIRPVPMLYHYWPREPDNSG